MEINRFGQRKKRVKAKIARGNFRLRLSVFKSNKYIYAQIINDLKGKTLVAVSGREKEVLKGKNKIERAQIAGEILAKKAVLKKIKEVVFDKSGYKYHGIVKALAEGARKGGLVF